MLRVGPPPAAAEPAGAAAADAAVDAATEPAADAAVDAATEPAADAVVDAATEPPADGAVDAATEPAVEPDVEDSARAEADEAALDAPAVVELAGVVPPDPQAARIKLAIASSTVTRHHPCFKDVIVVSFHGV